MPQMFPMSWMMMFITFVVMYLLTTIFINYNYSHSPLLTSTTLLKQKLSWKW
uniref:ATP synthase F0 subunit 8 n=1 Tax=Tropostreptus austerus TaxID=2931679 RepID=A0A8T9JBV1_9MYRI|nr:ATP synthase F0 subunit 8 [Tropostreptus austerus]UOF70455.1 ATP synthase F0 subunit 8 [Tropostreptus austerus]